jgi:hypothetical protein
VAAGAQRAHDVGGRARGGELPAGLVPDGDAAAIEQRADAAREHAVDGGQGDGRATGLQVPQDAGGGEFRFLRGVGRPMQRDGAARVRIIERHADRLVARER